MVEKQIGPLCQERRVFNCWRIEAGVRSDSLNLALDVLGDIAEWRVREVPPTICRHVGPVEACARIRFVAANDTWYEDSIVHVYI